MTTRKTRPAPVAGAKIAVAPIVAAEGCWTIQIVNQDRTQVGRRYVCHARDDVQARAIAGRLAGSSRSIVGYDYHRLASPSALYATDLKLGGSQSIDNPETWAALRAV